MDQEEKDAYFKLGLQQGREESIKQWSVGYKSGYGQAKADLIKLVEEAMTSVREALRDAPNWNPPEETLKELKLKQQELHRIRALIKGAMKTEIAGH